MKSGPLAATLLILFLLGSASPSSSQQAGKKAKSPLASAIDGAAGTSGAGKVSPLTEDGEFLRRVMLDLVGYPPNLEQVKAFMADPNPNKRADKIDELLETEDWASRTARLFCEGWFGNYHDVPMMNVMPALDAGARGRLVNDFVAWLKMKLQKDSPYNKDIVDSILRARGTGTGDPSLLWKLACFHGDDGPVVEFANRVSKHFLGIRLKCAQCHDHPFDDWNEGHFYKLAAFFGRTKATGGSEAVIKETEDGGGDGYKMSGMSYQPQFLYGQKPAKGDQWMDALAVYMSADPQLATAAANRVWSWLFGRGLVHPVDDFAKTRPPFGGGLLGVLGREFKANKWSVKHLYRGICNSDTYQRSSANDAKLTKPGFGVGWIKHLDAEQLLNSIQVATTGRPSKNVGQAIGMVNPLFPADVVWCEVTPLPGNMRQALLLRNNSSIHGSIGGAVGALRGSSTAEKVTDAFLAVLSRKPSAAELERFVKYVDAHPGQGLEDSYWTLMNTAEFLTRH
jgi:hypothetical protein